MGNYFLLIIEVLPYVNILNLVLPRQEQLLFVYTLSVQHKCLFSSLTLLRSVRLLSVAHLYNVGLSDISRGYPVLIGCYKSCDIRIIDDIIVSCQQGQKIQHL